MNKIIRGIEQGSPEWMALRIGRIGGSRIADLLTEGRSGNESLTKRKYKNELISKNQNPNSPKANSIKKPIKKPNNRLVSHAAQIQGSAGQSK